MICDVPIPDDADGHGLGHEMSTLFAQTGEGPSFSGNLGTGQDAGASLRGCSPSSAATAAIFAPSVNGLAKDNEGLPPVESMTPGQMAHELTLLRCQNQQSFIQKEALEAVNASLSNEINDKDLQLAALVAEGQKVAQALNHERATSEEFRRRQQVVLEEEHAKRLQLEQDVELRRPGTG